LKKNKQYRFCLIKDAIAIYAGLLNYIPINWVIENIRKTRPPMEAEIGSELFKFIINVLTHFPYFNRWDDVWISKKIVNWNKEGQSIDKFLERYKGRDPVKYRFCEAKKRK
jgi:hypothetical protein